MAYDPHALYRRWLGELWHGSFGAVGEIIADDFVGHWPDRDVRGPDELVELIAETKAMFSELTFELEVGPLAEGDLVAGRWTGSGRSDDGELRFFGNDLLRVEQGRFAEYWVASSGGS